MPLPLSLSSRRAWIEIISQLYASCPFARRSPRGERGLKSKPPPMYIIGQGVALLAESVD